MSELGTVACPHCSVLNASPGEFCSSCGLAMPSAIQAAPRFVGAKGTAITGVGQSLQANELLNTARQAARSLLSIGIINLAFGALLAFQMYTVVQLQWQRVPLFTDAVIASMLIAGTMYVAMYYWAKFSPLTATIVGLAVYLAKWVVDVVIRETLNSGAATNSSANGYSVFRIIVVVYLIRGVAAGWRHRKLEQEQKIAGQPIRAMPVE